MRAFSLAMKRDSDGIELDIRLTADGDVVCVHDETLERVAGVKLAVADASLAELRNHYPVPLLSEALALLRPGKHMQIELKGVQPLARPLKQVLEQWGGDRRSLALSSFEEETIRNAAEFFPDLPRLLLVDLKNRFGVFPSAEQVMDYLRKLHCTGVSFKATTEADAAFVAALHAEKFRVVSWGVFSDELGLAMAALGVDAMTCNHAVALRRRWRERS
ncbi:MAG: hypothetical protein L6W00_26550 [Lentisphaeria bacterium]|nr:MAG: hypothetical protein L6W00_26550 [Lentisphaeria bacterium]